MLLMPSLNVFFFPGQSIGEMIKLHHYEVQNMGHYINRMRVHEPINTTTQSTEEINPSQKRKKERAALSGEIIGPLDLPIMSVHERSIQLDPVGCLSPNCFLILESTVLYSNSRCFYS